MPKMMLLAAVLAAFGIVSQPTEARDRDFGFRHFSGHAGPKLHLRHQSFKFHRGGVFGKPRAFKPRHFGHRGSAFKFGHAPRFKPRHFGHFGRGGRVLKFSTAIWGSSSAICHVSSTITSATGTVITGRSRSRDRCRPAGRRPGQQVQLGPGDTDIVWPPPNLLGARQH
jgi:hypothetical protein